MRKTFSRRELIKIAGGTVAAAAGASLLPRYLGKGWLSPFATNSAGAQEIAPDLYFAATDGWIGLPPSPALPPYHPDDLAPTPFTTYIFGFRNVTGLNVDQVRYQKMRAQHAAPLFWVDEAQTFRLQLTNLGLQMRPDLVDAHTLHWHGFRHVIPFFDGEPMGSVSVPIERNFTYVFRPRDPGTYMYHCHVEDIEHVHMGMTGMVFVRPAQNGQGFYSSGRYAYNDGDGSTGYDREFSMLLTEVWSEAHWDDSHIQLPEWTDYRVDFGLLNGRAYPDTLAPSGSVDPYNPVRDANGDLIPTPGYEHLQYQPISSLVTCNEGERVLLRLANLGFTEASMTTAGLKMRIIGRDATLMRGITDVDTSYLTNTISLGAGESADAIFTAPAYRGGANGQPYDTYLLYNRATTHGSNAGTAGYGGQMTEIRVYPTGTLPVQTVPNT